MENYMIPITEPNDVRHRGAGDRKKQDRKRKGTCVDIDKRNSLVEQYLPLVRTIALDMCASTTANVEYDDLVSVGVFGLIDSAKSYDTSRNVKFSTYCKCRIRGAMLDELRNLDWVPRLTRQRNNQLRKALMSLESQLDRKPSSEELAAEMNVDMKEFKKISGDSDIANMMSIDNTISDDGESQTQHDTIENPRASNPVEELQRKDSRNFIVKSLNKLERMIVTLYYYEQLTMRQIGETLNISESRVSQIHTEVLQHLRQRVSSNDERFILAI